MHRLHHLALSAPLWQQRVPSPSASPQPGPMRTWMQKSQWLCTHTSVLTHSSYVTFKIEPWSPFFTCKSNQLVPMPCNSPCIVKERQATQLAHPLQQPPMVCKAHLNVVFEVAPDEEAPRPQSGHPRRASTGKGVDDHTGLLKSRIQVLCT